MQRLIAIYVRVSSRKQDTRSLEPDLNRWAETYTDLPVRWYRDKFTGKTMDRPGWKRLEGDMIAGRVSKIVVWRLDRLGRTAAGLTALFEDLQPSFSLPNAPLNGTDSYNTRFIRSAPWVSKKAGKEGDSLAGLTGFRCGLYPPSHVTASAFSESRSASTRIPEGL
jgi:Resolvase, N terminal domain